jgi:preprotein translocase subunit SecG
MQTVVLVIHLMLAVALVAVVLLQRSEGGALGMGGGGGGGGFLTGRGTANLLTRTTAFLAAAFFCTSIVLTLLAQKSTAPRSIFETPPAPAAGAPATPGTAPAPAADGPAPAPAAPRGGLLDKLGGGAPAPAPAGPAVPQTR